MTQTEGFHESARRALDGGDPIGALDLLDQPWSLGLAMTVDELRENHLLETRARALDERLSAPDPEEAAALNCCGDPHGNHLRSCENAEVQA